MRRWWLVALAVAALVAIWLCVRPASEAPVAPPNAPAPLATQETAQRADEAPASDRRAAEVQAMRTDGEAGASRAPAARPLGRLTVEVVDVSGVPLPSVAIRVTSRAAPGPELDPTELARGPDRDATSDADGRALFEALAVGRYEVRATREEGGHAIAAALERVCVDEDGSSLRLTLGAPDEPLIVTVRDTAGAPVSGAEVELSSALGAPPATRTSDERGEARFEEFNVYGFVAVARKGELRGSARIWRDDGTRRAARDGLAIVLGAPAKLSGAVLGLAPERLSGARVLARLLDNFQPYYWTHGREESTPVVAGNYAFDALPAGTYTLAIEDPRGARLDLPPLREFAERTLDDSLDPLEVELAPGAASVQDLRAIEGATLEGLVRSSDGRALAGAEVRVTFAPRTPNVPDGYYVHGVNVWRFDALDAPNSDHPETHWRARSGADGRYRVVGLPAGRHRVELALSGWSFDRREGIALRAGESTSLEHVLSAAGAIEGVDRSSGYLGVVRKGEPEPRAMAVLPNDGLFRFPGLEPGQWTLAHFHSDENVAPVPQLDVRVTAGETVWVDVDRDGRRPIRIAGRVLDSSGPVAGASVIIYPQRLVTDADGRFETRVNFARTMWNAVEIERDGVRTRFEAERMQPGQREWEGEFSLGRESLLVRAFDADGKPTRARIEFQVELSEQNGVSQLGAEGLAIDASGERLVRDLMPGELHLSAHFPDGSTLRAQCELPRATPLDLRALASGALTVVAKLADGTPAVGYSLAVWTWTGERAAPEDFESFLAGAQTQWTHLDREGRASFAAVAAGELWIRAYDDRCRLEPNPSPIDLRRSLAPGQRLEVELRLEH